MFHLPTAGEAYAEPAELLSNHAVIESVQMQKVLGHVGIWEANADHLDCIKTKVYENVKCVRPPKVLQ